MALFIPGPAGKLEALSWAAQDADANEVEPRAAAIVAHPHPLGGGTMHNNVVFRIARGLQRVGLAVLRFNFRGVEESEGEHDDGVGEIEDAAAALSHLEREHPGLPLWAAGFSFGSRTVSKLALRDERIQRLVLVALPCKAFDCSHILEVRQPGLVLMAGRDEFGTRADLRELVGELPAHLGVDEVPDVDHFFKGATPEVERRVRAWAREQLATPDA